MEAITETGIKTGFSNLFYFFAFTFKILLLATS